MAKPISSDNSSDREKRRNKVFNALIKLTQNLAKDRQILEYRIKSLTQVIYQMKMEQKVESTKVELLLGFKERESLIYKKRYEKAVDELADFCELVAYLSQQNSEPKDAADDVSNIGESSRNKALQAEVRRLKSELEKFKSEKKSEISALLDEKNFVWNQYNKMDSDFTEKLRRKCHEVDQANEKIQLLVNKEEELQNLNERLKTDIAKMESESVQKSQEISGLSKEIEILKSETPILRQCSSKAGPSQKRGNKRTIDGMVITVKKESDASHTSEKMAPVKRSAHKSTGGKAPKKQFGVKKGSSSSKRKAVDVITIPDDTPKLFTSSFKVPKLKSSSSSPLVV
ncbi:hypothetical protein ACJIZ3_024808 [Penstemon smallii]|uniref:Uncharacterized protein n=1 Tax=Penstemon smallii TaxID=265156 RepID=A0ABD3TVH7_9LAMI